VKRILLVEDEVAVTFAYRKVLQSSHVVVDVAGDLEGALALVKSNTYDAAIVDLRLSGADTLHGLTIVKTVRDLQKECAIIVVTAYGDGETRRAAHASGAHRYLEKPVSISELQELLVELGAYPSS
jgi:DNA-binding response OmpR family regulator